MKEKILEVVDLCKEYPVKRGALLPKEIGRVHAVNHVSFTLYQGETLGIIGESGCGKTTLIRMLMGLEEATGGYVQFGDKKYTDICLLWLEKIYRWYFRIPMHLWIPA